MSKKEDVFNIERKIPLPKGGFFLFGPRGTGKSTWLQRTFPKALRIDLLDAEVHRALVARPERLEEMARSQPQGELIVDEIQKAPALLDVVHKILESGAPRRRVILTGSSARKLRRQGANLLAGRLALQSCHPFMACELGTSFELDKALRLGLLPLVWGAEDPEAALKAYGGLYLKEEVQAEGLVRDLGAFARFLETAAFSHGSQLNLNEMARECEITRRTAEGYVAVLEDLLLAFRISAFTKRARRHLVQHPKFYYFDAGVYRSLRPRGPLDRPEEMAGAALEGLVAQHLRSWIAWSGGDQSLHFWRTKSGVEVDFVVYGEDGIWACEVKSSARAHPMDTANLRAFLKDYPEARAVLVYGGKQALNFNGIHCLPAADFLKAIVPGRALPVKLS